MCTAYGWPATLVVEERSSAPPRDHEVLIRVRAAGVNFRDLLSVQNRYQQTPAPPFCPGCEVTGVVTRVGAGVSTFAIGDRVVAFTNWGGFAEEVVVPESWAIPAPAGMDGQTAAAFLLSYGTADHALHDRAALRPGDTLVVLGAGGSAGLAAIEVGKILGARVLACATTQDKRDACLAHGADAVLDYSAASLSDGIRQFTKRGADVIYDTVGGESTEAALRALAWRGRLAVVGFASGGIPRIPVNLLLVKGCSLVGIWWGDFVRREPAAFRDSAARLTAWYHDGRIRPHVSSVFPLDRLSDAFARLASRQLVGKTVLAVGGEVES